MDDWQSNWRRTSCSGHILKTVPPGCAPHDETVDLGDLGALWELWPYGSKLQESISSDLGNTNEEVEVLERRSWEVAPFITGLCHRQACR